jgi:PAS domain S-box-containing protein
MTNVLARSRESERVTALYQLGILDTPPDERFDRVTRIAQRLFQVPIAAVVLVDATRYWYKAIRGLPIVESPRTSSLFSQHVVEQGSLLVVEDARLDPRFADHSLVRGEPAVRFYAGQPLRAPSGHVVGTFSVTDDQPRRFADEDCQILQDLAAIVEDEIAALQLKRAATLLRNSEERYHGLITALDEGIVLNDRQGLISGCNPSAERILGVSAEQLIGRTWADLTLEFVRKDGSSLPADQLPPAVTTRTGQLFRHTRVGLRRPGGATSWLAMDTRRLGVHRDQPTEGVVTWFGDITAEINASDQAREQASLLDLAHDSMIVWDLATREIRFWNHGAEATYGWPRAEALGQPAHNLLQSQHPRPLAEIEAEVIAEGTWNGEVIQRTRRGDSIIVESRWALQCDARGQPAGVLEVSRDITHRRAAERRLEQQYHELDQLHGRNRAILDAAGDAMVFVTPDSRLQTVNHRFTEIFGLGPEEVIGRPFAELQSAVERAFERSAAFLELVTGTATDRQRQIRAVVAQRWPQRRELELFSTAVNTTGGEYLGRLYVFRDVTREREIDRMKSEFVSLVSHELRTPLTSIKGFVDLLLDEEAGEVTSEQREMLAIVKNNADRLVALINELLDVSRIESGKLELRRAPLELAALIQRVAASLRPQVEAKNQTLTLNLPADLPTALGDADRVTQILTNLLANAHQYTPAGGVIAVSAAAEGTAVRVAVQDTGIGIAPEDQAQLFTKFFRAHNRTTEEVGGSGLGLAITRSLVEMHGGTLTVASTVGAGSTFAFTLPQANAQPARVAAADALPATSIRTAGPAPSTAGRLILVVDDEPDIGNLVARYLGRAGYRVRLVHDGATALAAARSEHPDLITLDVMLPDCDGFTVLDWLKSDAATASIPVVLLSVVDDGGLGARLGAVGYLRKPVDEWRLLDRVYRVLAHGPATRILLADDETNVRSLVATYLRRAGYQVIEASGGAEALRLAHQHAPHLVLLDVRMPDLDGIAVLHALRAAPDTRNLPVIMMTGYPGILDEGRSTVERLGCAALLTKPLTAEELAATLASALATGASR